MCGSDWTRSASEPIDDSLYFDHNNNQQPILYLAIAANLLGNHETLSTGFGSRHRILHGNEFLTAVLFSPQQILVHIRSSSSLANPKQEKHWRGFFSNLDAPNHPLMLSPLQKNTCRPKHFQNLVCQI
jgi:hypothetical protein